MRESLGAVKPIGEMKVKASVWGLTEDACLLLLFSEMNRPHSGGVSSASAGEAHRERTRWDQKDGELCLARMRSEETLMEVRFRF